MKRFYRLNGSSVLVTRKEWNRRTAIQDAAIRRRGDIPFRNRENKVYALDQAEYRKRVSLQSRGRFYAGTSLKRLERESTETGQKTLSSRLRRQGFITDQIEIPGEKYYPGPTGTVCNMAELGGYMAEVLDILPVILKADGRPNVVTRVQFSVGLAGEAPEVLSMAFISSKRGDLTRTQQLNDFRSKLATDIQLMDLEIPGYGDSYSAAYFGRDMPTGQPTSEIIQGGAGLTDVRSGGDFDCIEIRSMYAVAPI